jgi:hypothetical protein
MLSCSYNIHGGGAAKKQSLGAVKKQKQGAMRNMHLVAPLTDTRTRTHTLTGHSQALAHSAFAQLLQRRVEETGETHLAGGLLLAGV